MTKKFKWWHGLAFYAGVQLVRVALRSAAHALSGRPQSRKLDRRFYRSQRLPVFAPPPVAFPIAWSINSVSAIAGGLQVLNLPPGTDGRAEFLRWQGASWILYAGFEAAYFSLRSPINSALVTVAYTAATAKSVQIALTRLKDPRVAMSLGTTAAWLLLANPVGITQAAWNRDPFWKTGALVRPPRNWIKSR
jgi:tryptophan-rich sensory protein